MDDYNPLYLKRGLSRIQRDKMGELTTIHNNARITANIAANQHVGVSLHHFHSTPLEPEGEKHRF